MSARSELPPEFVELPFSRIAAITAGVPASRLRAKDLSAPFHGVRHGAQVSDDLEWRCLAYLERMRAGNAFSHATAARLYGLPLPLYVRDIEQLHVATLAGHRPPNGRNVIGHEIAAHLWSHREVVVHDYARGHLFALPVVSPATVWAQLAAVLDEADLVAVGDAIVGGDKPLAGVADLRSIPASWVRHRGAKSMASSAQQIRRGSLSRPESLVRLQCIAAGIPEPELNVVVQDRAGVDIAMADLVWSEFRVLVEYEGDGHRSSKGKFRSDITRVERYADGEWFALRAHADDVFGDPNPFIERLARRLRRAGWKPRRELRQIVGARP